MTNPTSRESRQVQSEQPEALRLIHFYEYHGFFDSDKKAATELRRLHLVNQELVEALEYCRQKIAYMTTHGEWYSPGRAIEKADAALSKARGEG